MLANQLQIEEQFSSKKILRKERCYRMDRGEVIRRVLGRMNKKGSVQTMLENIFLAMFCILP